MKEGRHNVQMSARPKEAQQTQRNRFLFSLTAKRDSLRCPSGVLAADAAHRPQQLEAVIAAVTGDGAGANPLRVERDRAVGGRAREPARRGRVVIAHNCKERINMS